MIKAISSLLILLCLTGWANAQVAKKAALFLEITKAGQRFF